MPSILGGTFGNIFALKTWTVLETVLSVVGFGMAALIYQFV